MSRATLLLALALLAGCPKQQGAAKASYSGPPKAFKLLGEAPEIETAQRKEKRTDLYVTTDTGDPIPSVVATGQAGPLTRQGGRIKLYGDEAGKEGWSVDNFLLLEILDKNNAVTGRVAVGFQQGITLGSDVIDTAGGLKFQFEAGEVELTRYLPAEEPFSIRATALDVGGVGRITNVYMILTPDTGEQDPGEIREKL